MKATIYDVAKEAGVSIATISNAIHGKGKMSKERRAHILDIVDRLQYQPSMIASALTGKRTYTIGLLIPDIANPFFAEIARAVENRARQLGYSVIICSTDHNHERVESYIHLLLQKRIDGLVIGTGLENVELLAPLLTEAIPVAFIARDCISDAVHKVIVDDYLGGRLAARHLLDRGHRRIAVLSEKHNGERVRGFRQALEAEGLELPDELVQTCDYRIEDGKRAAANWLAHANRPTALFCCNDLSAIGALQAARENGISVPGELSIVSFDNTLLAAVSAPSLTTIAQPIEQMGKLVIDMLVKELQMSTGDKQRIVLSPELIIRESTGMSPKNKA
ncbi:LacI family transcriptional regulator [Paenibacillus sp. SYP-B3998]|uniref:LacI family transcriptional regulator n=1 Tax=Paenibacillus sp. SYP-B3998 TaxID=2678564 RepID=A0A6G4A4I3_9BACL|nr:LacI family transcriptional regulator [Paenibacillus sp. SYP-B3998]